MRRECLDHIVIFNERHLRRVLTSYLDYYHRTRTHLSLDQDCPDSRPVMLPRIGRVVAVPQVSGLHHRYERSPPDQHHFLFANVTRLLFQPSEDRAIRVSCNLDCQTDDCSWFR
jgi:hypothetical protein